VVQRGETLSQIATGVSGTSQNSPEARSWMLAIFQANPHAFEQNMNVLRTGAVLRIPDNSAVSSISPAAAATEIRRQYAAWRSDAGQEGTPSAKQGGQLHLVTPSGPESAGPSNGASSSGEVKTLQGRVHDLEGQLNESKRLLQMREAELADLQSRLANANKAPAASPAAPPPPVAQQPSAAPPPPAEQPPAAQATPPAAATPAPAEQPPAQQPAESAPPPVAAAPKTPQPAHQPKPVAHTQGGSFLDTLMDYWWALALIVVAVAGYLGFKSWRARRESEFDDSLSRLAVAGASSAERGFASGDTAPMRPVGGEDPEGAFLVEESGTHQRPRLGAGGAPAPAAARHVATTDETISSETAINLDQGDPLAEADFHMAYGLYDQAADLIRIAINREPNRRDLKLKLLEVFFVWGNKEQFLTAARELAATREDAAPGEWEKIVIMGKQLAPEDPLFAGGGATSGAMAGGVDLDLEGGQSRVDFDLLGEPVPGLSGSDVDLDIGSALGEGEGTPDPSSMTATDRNAALDANFGNNNSTGTTRQMTARIPQESDDLLPEFGSDTEGPTVEQPAMTSIDNPTIRQKVAMALKQTPSAEQTAELAIDDLGLDLAGLDTVDQPGLGASPDAPTLVAGMDDRSRKIIEEAQRRAETEDHSLATGAWQLDENELDAALSEGQQEEHDPSVTSRLSALTGRDVDFDLGEAPVDHSANGSGLDLDLGTATVPDTAFTVTQKLSSDDLALPDLEPVTMSEVGTKLDLARAYMDMGDPDGAKNILEEVLHEGSMTQKQEAQRLMESLPG